MKRLVAGLVKEVQGGSSFSQALGHYPDVFPYSYCQVVRASEQAGELETGLRQAADYMERQQMVTSKIRRALTYPTLISAMAIVVFVLMVTVVLPPMVQLFSSLGAHLPWTTRLIIGVMEFLTEYKLYLLAGILTVVAAILAYSRTSGGKLTLDRMALKTPVIGFVILYRVMGQFCRTAAMLLHAGLPLPQIMDVTIRTVSANRLIKQALTEVRDRLVQGEGLSHPMSENTLFPRMMVKMIAMAEQTGGVDTALTTLADYFDTRANQRIQSLVAMIEPTLTVIIGIAVAFILLSIIMPLYSVLGAMR
jgi:type II secretory pathway component PulF